MKPVIHCSKSICQWRALEAETTKLWQHWQMHTNYIAVVRLLAKRVFVFKHDALTVPHGSLHFHLSGSPFCLLYCAMEPHRSKAFALLGSSKCRAITCQGKFSVSFNEITWLPMSVQVEDDGTCTIHYLHRSLFLSTMAQTEWANLNPFER